MPREMVPIRLTGGVNNRHTALDLFFRQRGELVNLVNADTTYFGEIRPLRPLAAVNSEFAGTINSILRADSLVLVGAGTGLKYLSGSTLETLITGLSGNRISMDHIGDWVFLCDGTSKAAVYVSGPTHCDWGQAIPSAGPTVSVGAAGNPDGTYSCYYRYRITLPDGTVILTALSATAVEVTVSSQKIEWSNIVHASYTGASSVQVDLFRTKTGMAGTFKVTTLNEGTTTYSDNLTDAQLEANDAYAEEGYWPPPSNLSIIAYHDGCDRVFCAVGNSAYWSMAATYFTFLYDEDALEYTNVNDVFPSGVDITSIQMLDEQLYFGCKTGWKRLRGTEPDSWNWETTSAKKGPINHESCAATRWGIIYPGNDGRIWIFNGFDASPFIEHFMFDTNPTPLCHASFDGRFYRLFYDDPTYPELIIDLFDYPASLPRVLRSTRSATASHYCNSEDEFYLGSDGYLRNGEDTDEEVTITIETPEIPPEDLTKLGNHAKILTRVDTGGDDMEIVPKEDGVSQTALTAVTSTGLEFKHVPLELNLYHTLALVISITSSADVRIMDPILLAAEDG